MAAITIYDNEEVTVWCYPEKKLIHHKMHKYTHGPIFREALMSGVEAMKKYGADKWLSDDRNNPVLTPEDQKWGTDVWQPQVFAAGWHYWAIVQPENVIAKIRMEKLANEFSKKGVIVQFFIDTEEAMKWIICQ